DAPAPEVSAQLLKLREQLQALEDDELSETDPVEPEVEAPDVEVVTIDLADFETEAQPE
ncbi:hypothetical protein KIPB_012971, partial [Kipferlia bialata]